MNDEEYIRVKEAARRIIDQEKTIASLLAQRKELVDVHEDSVRQMKETYEARLREHEFRWKKMKERIAELEEKLNDELVAAERHFAERKELERRLEEAKSLPLPETHVLLADANNRLTVRVAELEERANKLHRLYNDAQDNASKEAERRVELEQEKEQLREENERMAEDYERGQIETDYGNYVSVALYGQALNENERLEKCWQRDSAKLDLAEQEIERLLRLVETVDRQRIENGDKVERLRAGQRNDGDLIEGLRQEVKQLRKDREDDLLQHSAIMQKLRDEKESLLRANTRFVHIEEENGQLRRLAKDYARDWDRHMREAHNVLSHAQQHVENLEAERLRKYGGNDG
jgi:hypothetical protein